ncbi:MAG: galactokinase [Lachnospiraceae bacterium]|jgi:D-glycero-alpha-D-manno-heptose-7-phosphate kinase|nr:galactokinase [Lachnospiraceae bacterium]MBQ6319435.1 GHMP kinase [Lachnospiraceae bacterium]MBQ8666985.1 GHMP kinase [Lachnospiraceae bacterium]MBR1450856.1 GHMP kinase [Lachnospiraceae bacterium]
MIIARSPLRITLGGGGTDLPSYYEEREGFLISAAIDKYVYITLHETFEKGYFLKYSKFEKCEEIDEIQHPIIREALRLLDWKRPCLELCSMADIPAGTGLGSSSSFTTALLRALHTMQGNIVSTRTLAEEACEIEMNRLKEPIGKQDQYIASYGGITCMNFHRDGYVWVDPLRISDETLYNLEDNLILFFTGFSRSAGNILKEQNDKSKQHDEDMIKNLDFVKDLGYQSKDALEKGDLDTFADIMNTHWEYKKKRSGGMSNPQIDEWYSLALANGAQGGKMIGAGGGGFLMFYVKDKARLRDAMRNTGMSEVRFRFEKEGSRVL